MNRIIQIMIALLILYVIYWIYVSIFLSDIVISVMFLAFLTVAYVFYKSMVES